MNQSRRTSWPLAEKVFMAIPFLIASLDAALAFWPCDIFERELFW
jgi:hypothetical protein